MRALKILVIVMGVLLVAGTTALVIVVVARVNRPAAPPAPAVTGSRTIELPPGARVIATEASGDRLVVRLALSEGGEELLIFDLASGARIASIMLQTKPGTP